MSESELNYEFVQQYLQAKGWKSHQSRRSEVGIWRTSDGSEEVQVPLTRELGDYALTLRRVAESIARVEARDVSRVLGDLARPRADAVRFGLVGDAMADGTTSLMTGVDFFESIRSALTAGASSAKRPQPHFPRMGFAEAAEYVGRCRLGQTEVGSYVVAVTTPLELGVADEVETPNFGRRATEALVRGVSEMVTHVRAHTEDQLLERVGPVSSNLCQAIVAMAPPDESTDIQLQASWSPLLPSSVTAAPVRVEHELYERIELLGDRLRASAEPERLELIVALVSRLSGAPDAQGRMAGEVILTPVFPKRLRRLSVRLSADQYEVAGQAHLQNAYVRTGGTLRRTGRTVVLTAQDFVLMASE